MKGMVDQVSKQFEKEKATRKADKQEMENADAAMGNQQGTARTRRALTATRKVTARKVALNRRWS